tara:strand:+ start:5790 stop:6311 length:522 start_codon:yes stop_codon:yes gene_type:complete
MRKFLQNDRVKIIGSKNATYEHPDHINHDGFVQDIFRHHAVSAKYLKYIVACDCGKIISVKPQDLEFLYEWDGNENINEIHLNKRQTDFLIALSIEPYINTEKLKGQVDSILNMLSERQQFVIKARYGIDPEHPFIRTFKDIGDDLDLSKQRIEQIHSEIVERYLPALSNKRA